MMICCMTHLRSSWLRSLGIGAMAVLVLGGAGCRNPFQEDATAVLQEGYTRAVQAEHSRYEAQGTVQFAAALGNTDAPIQGLSVQFDAQGSDSGRGAAATSTAAQRIAITVDTSEAIARANVQLDSRWVEGKTYLRLGDITAKLEPKAGTDAVSAPEVKEMQMGTDAALGAVKGMLGGKWIAIDLNAIAGMVAALDPEIVPPKLPTGAELDALDARLRAALQANPLLVLRTRVGTEKLDGVRTYHYTVGLNRSSILPLMEAVAADLQLTASDLDEARTALADPKVIAALDQMVGDIWIAKKSKDVMRMRITVDSEQFADAEFNKEGRLTGTIDMRFRDWGKAAPVEAPKDAVPIEELLGGLLGGAAMF